MIRLIAGTVVAALIVATAVLAAPSPQAAWLDTGIDLDVAGNEPLVLGEVQSCRSVNVGDTFPIDVWLVGMPEPTPEHPENGIAGISYNLHYDPAVVNITEVNNDFMIVQKPGTIPYAVIDSNADNGVAPDPMPSASGNLRVDFADINADGREGGDGVLTRLTMQAVGAGTSTLILQDDLYDNFPAPSVISGPPSGALFFVNVVNNAVIAVGQSCDGVTVPPPVDVGGLGGTIPGGSTPPPNPAPGPAGVARGSFANPPEGSDPGSDPGAQPTDAASGSPGAGTDETSVAVDAVPDDNEATVLGEIETCASAEVGDTFIVDLVINNVEDLLAFEISVGTDPTILEIVDRDVEFLLNSAEGSQVVDTSKQTPDDSGLYTTGAVDTADPLAPDSGSGVLVRLTLEAKGEGASDISLDPIDANDDGKADRGVFLRNADGDIIGDTNEDTFFDGPIAGAEILVGESCPDSEATVVKASAGSESGNGDNGDDDGSDALPFVIAGAIAAGLLALTGAGYLAYRRRNAASTAGAAPTEEPPPTDPLS